MAAQKQHQHCTGTHRSKTLRAKRQHELLQHEDNGSHEVTKRGGRIIGCERDRSCELFMDESASGGYRTADCTTTYADLPHNSFSVIRCTCGGPGSGLQVAHACAQVYEKQTGEDDSTQSITGSASMASNHFKIGKHIT